MATPARPHTPAPYSGVERQTRITIFSGSDTSIEVTPDTASPQFCEMGV